MSKLLKDRKSSSSVSNETTVISLKPIDNKRLAKLCGPFDENIRQIESHLGVEISNRGNEFQIIGSERNLKTASNIINHLYKLTEDDSELSAEKIHLYLQEAQQGAPKLSEVKGLEQIFIRTKQETIRPHGKNQSQYVHNVLNTDITFAVGPAGTGKTYLAVACAVQALEQELVSRIILVRPAIEAGESLGFLPGSMAEKVDPYLRPLYDALYEMLGFDTVGKYIEQNIIELAPLAYMRGRNLNDSFIILDEAQNTTREQMKMFLTRIGFGSITVITGDITQIDLPKETESGLRHAIEVLKDIDGISFSFFQTKDVVRHPLVQLIITAYDKYINKDKSSK